MHARDAVPSRAGNSSFCVSKAAAKPVLVATKHVKAAGQSGGFHLRLPAELSPLVPSIAAPDALVCDQGTIQ